MTHPIHSADAELDLDRLEALAKAATPGDWTAKPQGRLIGGPMRHYVNGSAQAQIASFSVTFHDQAPNDEPERQQANTDFSAGFSPATALRLVAMARAAAQVGAKVARFTNDGEGNMVENPDGVWCYYEDACAALAAGAPAETPKPALPKWIDNEKGKDPFMDDAIGWIEANIATPAATIGAGEGKDAARWRWMREHWFLFGTARNINTALGHDLHRVNLAGDAHTLDVAIDAAMRSKTSPGEAG